MKRLLAWTSLGLFLWFYTACSGVRFSKQVDLKQYGTGCTQQSDSKVYCEHTDRVEGGRVDVLIVNDNSASMSYEQARLASRFNNFVNLLENKFINYRIAMTTTDISSAANAARPVNQNGALQDGKLIPFPTGLKFVSPQDGTLSDRISWFNQTINRKETLDCEKFIIDWHNSGKNTESAGYDSEYLAHCPSTDERGIYAANLVLQNNPDSFLRTEADLAVIFLSDEDERSGLYDYQTGYALESLDRSSTLIDNLKNLYPGKSFGVHAIITKTESCKVTQGSQTLGVVSGSYGWEYYNAVEAAKAAMASSGVSADVTAKMVAGDICSSDYTSQLNQIFDHIAGQIKDSFPLSCENPQELAVTVSTPGASIDYTVVGKVLKFSSKLPVGSTVSYRYTCPF